MKRWLGVLGLAAVVLWAGLYVRRFHNAQPIFAVRGTFTTVDDAKLYVVERGAGRPLLFLHGFPYRSESVLKLPASVFARHRVIAPDLPGLGLSDKRLEGAVTPGDLALTIKLLLDRRGLKDIDVLGHDLGGGVAMVLAARYPNLVRRLVLLAPDCSAGRAGETYGPWWRWPVAGEAWAALVLDRGHIRHLLRESWGGADDGWLHHVEAAFRPLQTLGGRRGFLSLHRGRMDFDYLTYEERLATPALIVWGERDEVNPPEHGRELAAGLPGARLEILPGIGHLLLEQAPQGVADLMLAFLDDGGKEP